MASYQAIVLIDGASTSGSWVGVTQSGNYRVHVVGIDSGVTLTLKLRDAYDATNLSSDYTTFTQNGIQGEMNLVIGDQVMLEVTSGTQTSDIYAILRPLSSELG